MSLIGYSYNPTSPISFCFALHFVTHFKCHLLNYIGTVCNIILTSQLTLQNSLSSLSSTPPRLSKTRSHILPHALRHAHLDRTAWHRSNKPPTFSLSALLHRLKHRKCSKEHQLPERLNKFSFEPFPRFNLVSECWQSTLHKKFFYLHRAIKLIHSPRATKLNSHSPSQHVHAHKLSHTHTGDFVTHTQQLSPARILPLSL